MKLLLLLLGAGKLGNLLTSGGTMLLSVLAYAFVYGWWYAAGFVALLFCHEMGHFLAARRRGLPVGLPASAPANQHYYAVSNEDKFTYGAFYLGLIVFLSLMLHGLHTELGGAG